MLRLCLIFTLCLLFNTSYAQKQELKKKRKSSEVTYVSESNGKKTYQFTRYVYRRDGSLAEKWDYAPATEKGRKKDSIAERMEFRDTLTSAGKVTRGYLISDGAADTLRS